MIKTFLIHHWWVVILLLLFIIVLSFMVGSVLMNYQIKREVETLKNYDFDEPTTIQEKDVNTLPLSVQRWLKYTGIIGKERIQFVEFNQRGEMRLRPEQEDWMNPVAKQYVRINDLSFLWHVDLPMLPLINTKGRDLLLDGNAQMSIKIGGLIPVVSAQANAKLNESALHRFLLELPWYPTAALEDYITWRELDENQAEASLTHNGVTVSATFHFETNGELLKIEALRYKEHDETAERILCIGEVEGYVTVHDMKIPNAFHVTWVIDDQVFTWYKLENYNFTYELP